VPMDRSLHTSVDEIADQVFRLSTWVPDISEHGFTFNQFLLTGDQPFLFHCGMRQLFPLVSAAIAKVIPLEQLRWISFAHVEADECGAMNLLLAAAPHAEVIRFSLVNRRQAIASACARYPSKPAASAFSRKRAKNCW
jgi:flavorubredoxin